MAPRGPPWLLTALRGSSQLVTELLGIARVLALLIGLLRQCGAVKMHVLPGTRSNFEIRARGCEGCVARVEVSDVRRLDVAIPNRPSGGPRQFSLRFLHPARFTILEATEEP